ncbi:hypothetical protein [Chitinophaga rhizophila]|uniref:Uncharacterized protein n=1 Tax=Chitinophaga rhizophila TaxID=2866212 RepID=A0ABS7G6S8_9BACT|nr:hypothetical protein [Chitinophaga rhizophila]MBW8683363.1 hypothetical protein [Chitinophaga rhizophila]
MKTHTGHLILTLTLLSLSVNVLSCGRMKDRQQVWSERTATITATEISHTQQVAMAHMEEVFPTYHSTTPDTDDNKKRFREHLEVDATPDVRGLYTYTDFMGADYEVLIAFTCDKQTISNIVRRNGMKLSADTGAARILMNGGPAWWKSGAMERLVPYQAGDEDGFWQYLWYNPVTGEAFYKEFSL